MGGVNFSYTASPKEQSETFQTIRMRHIQETSVYDDNFYLTQVFDYLSETYKSWTLDCLNSLRQKKEEDITDFIRRELRNNKQFILNGFIVNTEARNNSNIVGYYDLKFEHSDWLNEYLVLECKPINMTKSKVDSYFHKTIKSKDDDGGLYRFLINKYATDKSFGGMLGYIISNTPKDVVDNLKAKIKQFDISNVNLSFGGLQDEKLLEESIANFDYSFQSNHIRMCNTNNRIISPIHIFHIFFDLTR